MYNILIVGAGYLGTQIARDFKARKQNVFAVTRNPEKGKVLEAEGIQPVVADLLKPETLAAIPPAHFIVLCAAPDTRNEEGYLKTYVDGVRNFLDSRKGLARPYLILHISSTSVWKNSSAGGRIDETVPADNDALLSRILLASENLTLNSGYPAVIYRLSGIYGPGRNRLKVFQSGAWPASGEADTYMNMIHVEDAVQSAFAIFKSAKDGEIYIGTDDEPVLRSEFCRWLGEKTGKICPPPGVQNVKMGKHFSNQALKKIGFQFRYPTFREGYEELIRLEGVRGK